MAAYIKLLGQDYQELVVDTDLDNIRNTSHQYPCPDCGDYRILFDVAIPKFTLTCRKCKYIWELPMSDGDIERYTNIELNRIIQLRKIPESSFNILMRKSIVKQIQKKRSKDVAESLLRGEEYRGYVVPNSLWGNHANY